MKNKEKTGEKRGKFRKRKPHQGINNYVNALCSKTWRLLSCHGAETQNKLAVFLLTAPSLFLIIKPKNEVVAAPIRDERTEPSVAWRSCQGTELSLGSSTFQKPGSNISCGSSEPERKAVLQLWVGVMEVFGGIWFIKL